MGKFISPHLTTARERFVINGRMIEKEDFIKAAEHVLFLGKKMREEPSFFECVLAMALWLFREHGVDVAILEAGLGGRLDATTAVKADILAVTSIDLDHQSILGDTIDLIAYEKLLAARRGQPVVLADKQKPLVLKAAYSLEQKTGFNIHESSIADHELSLLGSHQKINAGLAIKTLEIMDLLPMEQEMIESLKETFWPGRIEVFFRNCPIVLDGAHNQAGMESLIDAIKQDKRFNEKPCFLIFGATRGHDAEAMIKVLLCGIKYIKKIFLYESKNLRAQKREELLNLFAQIKQVEFFNSLEECEKACSKAGGYILMCGSLYALGEVRAELTPMARDIFKPSY